MTTGLRDQLTDGDLYVLRRQRVLFWQWVSRIAVGVFIALAVWSALIYLLLKIWIDQSF